MCNVLSIYAPFNMLFYAKHLPVQELPWGKSWFADQGHDGQSLYSSWVTAAWSQHASIVKAAHIINQQATI